MAARKAPRITTGVGSPGILIRAGNTVDLRVKRVTVFAASVNALERGKIIGGATQSMTGMTAQKAPSGNIAPLQGR